MRICGGDPLADANGDAITDAGCGNRDADGNGNSDAHCTSRPDADAGAGETGCPNGRRHG